MRCFFCREVIPPGEVMHTANPRNPKQSVACCRECRKGYAVVRSEHKKRPSGAGNTGRSGE